MTRIPKIIAPRSNPMHLPRSHFPFPDPRQAPATAPIASGGELSDTLLLTAYRHGIFPWYSGSQPILWWCPDPRFVLFPEEFHAPHSLRRQMRDTAWEVTFDQAFPEVIEACATVRRRGQEGTWITPAMREAYTLLHKLGYAHSVECWREGKLAGGLYGVTLGSLFFGESMFHWRTDASKVAFARLVEQLQERGCTLIDCQQPTRHLAGFGARCIPRDAFLDRVETGRNDPLCLMPRS